MALNFSHRPMFSAHLSEDNLGSPMRISSGFLVDGVPERNSDVYGTPWQINREVVDCLDFLEDTCEGGGSRDCVSGDVLDLLPSDPFGMDINTTFTAITGWLDDLKVDYDGGYGRDERVPVDGSYQFFAGLNFIWNNAFRFQGFPHGNRGTLHSSDELGGFGAWSDGRTAGDGSCHNDPESPYVVDTIQTLGIEPETSGVQPKVLQEGSCVSSDAGEPHAAFSFVLGYLGTRELLAVERVCKSLRLTAKGDPFFWRNIHIYGKNDVNITDDVLLKLTCKAQGGLECLSLVNCISISDDGLKEVLLNNPKLTKLCVPGCTKLTIGGIISNLTAFKTIGRPGIKHLSIAGMYGVTEKEFTELEKLLLGTDNSIQLNTHEPRFYRGGIYFPSCSDGRTIDIEKCPKCTNLRLVYDCPVVGCKGKKEGETNTNTDTDTQRCRACTLCIARCEQCGRCIDDNVHEETFCLEFRCVDCGKQQSKCE